MLVPAIFAGGILAQAFILTSGKWKDLFNLVGISLLLSLLSFIPSKRELSQHTYDMATHVLAYPLMFFLIFVFIFIIAYRDKILLTINEQTVLSFTIMFWFVAGKYLFNLLACVGVFAIIATMLTALMCFTDIRIGRYPRAFFHAWFILMALFLCMSQFSASGLGEALTNFASIEQASPELMLLAFFGGMTSLYICAYGFYLFMLIPIPGKHQSLSERLRQWEEDIDFLADRYSGEQIKPIFTILIIVIEGGLLLLNNFYPVVSDFILINFFIIISQIRMPFLFK